MRLKKGTTLAELCVVMAITAIVSTVIVSFSVLIHAHIGRIAQSHNIQSDLDLISHANARWLGAFDRADFRLRVNADGSLSALDADGRRFTIRCSDKLYLADMPDGGRLEYPVTSIEGVCFSLRRGGAGGFMLVCEVKYKKTASATGMQLERSVKYYKYVYAAKEAAG